MNVTAWPMGRGPTPSPDYVICNDLQEFIAYGLGLCWLSHDPDDLNADANMARPLEQADVFELRGYFLDLFETVTVALWNGDFKPGDGEIDGDWQSLVIGRDDENRNGGDDTIITWYVRLDHDAIMFELNVTGGDSTAIWLDYQAIQDRRKVVEVLAEARLHAFDKRVWSKLLHAAAQ